MAPDNILLKKMLTDDSINKKSENLRFIAISEMEIMVVSTEKTFNNFCYRSKSHMLRFKLGIDTNTIKSKAANASYQLQKKNNKILDRNLEVQFDWIYLTGVYHKYFIS